MGHKFSTEAAWLAEMRKPHPSNDLQNREDLTFESAMTLYREQHRREFGMHHPDATPEEIQRSDEEMQAANLRVNTALEIYHRVMSEARKQIDAELRAADMEDFATALETGDYSGLAI